MLAQLRRLISGASYRNQPDLAMEALLGEARSALAAGELDSAEAKVQEALQIAPDPSAFRLGGAIAAERKDFVVSRSRFAEAIRYRPRDSGLRCDFGRALLLMGAADDAEIEYRLALKLENGNSQALRGLLEALILQKKFQEGLSLSRELQERLPENPWADFAAGFSAYRLMRFSEAYPMLRQAVTAGNNDSLTFASLGAAAFYLKRPSEAEDVLREGLEHYPDNGHLQYALSQVLLAQGMWREGLRLHECRFPVLRALDTTRDGERWRAMLDNLTSSFPQLRVGEFANQKILVIAEQGFGDSVMMMRFLPVLLERGAAKVGLVCPGALLGLREAMPSIDFIVAQSDIDVSLLDYTVQCSIMSLPYFLEIVGEPFPGNVPYLFLPQEKFAHWGAWIAQRVRSGKFSVGLAWAGNPDLSLDALRSIPLIQLQPLLDVPGVTFVNLQKDHDTREEMQLSEFEIIDPMHEVDDFLDTAAIIQNLDLVISVDTVVVHLAGALGKPVWMLNRYESEWRWQFDRTDSGWYPTMRIFNQIKSREWDAVILDVRESLRCLVESRRMESL